MKKPFGITFIAYILLIIPILFFVVNVPLRGLPHPDMLLVIALCVVIGYGLRKGRAWGSPLLMVLWLVVIHEHLGNNRFHDNDLPHPTVEKMEDLRMLVVYLVLAGASYWYFYRKPAVGKYYDELKNPLPVS